jgi:LasA protease
MDDALSAARTPGRFLPIALWILILMTIPVACVRPGPGTSVPPSSGLAINQTSSFPDELPGDNEHFEVESDTDLTPIFTQFDVPQYEGVPTPDAAHYTLADDENGLPSHIVIVGETLGILAQRYNTSIEVLIALNELSNPDIIHAGQVIVVPGEIQPSLTGSDFKIIPDSELVYGPNASGFEVRPHAEALESYLLRHEEEVEGQLMDGPAIVQLVADRHSVNPRLLLAVLEHKTGWLTGKTAVRPLETIGYIGPNQSKLYVQLSWAANNLNRGFYGRAEGGLRHLNIGESGRVNISATVNHGTAGVQTLYSGMAGITYEDWLEEVGPAGLHRTYTRLFGNPFGYTVDPLIPDDLKPPVLSLPWPVGETWYYTSGPHGAWNSGSAWGALDFAPPGEQLGCVPSDYWVTSMTDGVVVRSGHGAVVVDLDEDEYAGTRWAITYMHLETRDRVPVGTRVTTGDRLGHPSCEGGFSNGTHIHIARSYNGRWVSADTHTPFMMSGWVSQGEGIEYNGFLIRNGEIKEACACRDESNAIAHDLAIP